MTSSPTKLGIVGLSAGGSWASRSHLLYIQNNPQKYQITALLNSSKASAEASVKKYDLAPSEVKCYDDPASLAADPNVDVVVISVKVPEHRKAIEPALKAGKDVFCEWPLGRDLAEAEYFVSLAKQHNVQQTMVGLQARQDPAIRKAKAMVEAGELGQIIGTRMEGTGLIYGPTMSSTEQAYLLPIENGANLVTIPAGHAIDALCWVLGEWKDLQATLANRITKFPLVDENGKVVKEADKTSHDYMALIGTLQNGGGIASVVYQGGMSQTGRDFFLGDQRNQRKFDLRGSAWACPDVAANNQVCPGWRARGKIGGDSGREGRGFLIQRWSGLGCVPGRKGWIGDNL